jgi:hypothetical protein
MEQEPSVDSAAERSIPRRGRARKWLARVGLAGFAFFLVKGLVWLVLLFVVYEGCTA